MARLVPIDAYQAYAGPETGGFGVLPQSAVPHLVTDEETRYSPFGAGAVAPGAKRKMRLVPMDAPPIAPAAAPAAEARAAPPTNIDATLVNQSVVPKGGLPRQLTQLEAGNWSLYDRLREANRMEREVKGKGAGANIAERVLLRAGEAALATPSIVGDIISAPFRDPKQLIEEGMFGYVPRVGVEDVASGIAGVRAAAQGKDAGAAYSKAQEDIGERQAALAEEYPISTMAGNVGGDVLTIAGPRALMGPKVIEDAIKTKARREARVAAAAAKPGAGRYITRAANSTFSKWARKTGLRAAETSLEGATLAILHGGDPVQQAALSGASQFGGSLALAAGHHPVASTLLGSVILWQVLQNVTPLEGGSLDWTARHVIDKATAAGAVGLAAAFAGAGRFRGAPSKGGWQPSQFAEDFPRFAEGLNAALRTQGNSLWEQLTTEKVSGKPVIAPVLQKLTTNMDVFKPGEIRQLEQGAKSGDLRSTIERLSKDADFRTRMGMQ